MLAEFIDAFSLFGIEYKFCIMVTIIFLEILGVILLLIDFIICIKKLNRTKNQFHQNISEIV